MKKIFYIIIIINIISFNTWPASIPVPVGGVVYNGDTLVTPDSVRIYISDSLTNRTQSYISSLKVGWSVPEWDTTIYSNINGTWADVYYVFYLAGDSTTEKERYDLFDVTGSNSWVLVAYDSVNALPIIGADFTIKNSAGTRNITSGETNSNGELTINIPSGTYKVIPFEYNYTFSGSHTYIISSDDRDTIKAGPLNVSNPTLESTCSVYGYVSRAPGVNKSGIRVRSFINKQNVRLTRSQVAVSPIAVEDTTDTNGLWQLPLYISDSLTPETPWVFQILDSLGKPTHERTKFVPDSSQWYFNW